LTADAESIIKARLAEDGETAPGSVTILNTLGLSRKYSLVVAEGEMPAVCLKSPGGGTVPLQKSGGKTVFVAKDMPAFGLAVLTPCDKAAGLNTVSSDGDTL
jgi:hypothetical protein